jgi:hypothetical protein
MKQFLNNEGFAIFDDFIPIDFQNSLEQHILGFNFPWFYYQYTSDPNSNWFEKNKTLVDSYDSQQFVYVFFNDGVSSNSDFFPNILKILNYCCLSYGLKDCKLIRAKANLMLQEKQRHSNNFCIPHTDGGDPHYVLLYYINDSDGDTFLFDNNMKIIKRISPKKGRVLFFDGKIIHSSSHPIKNKNRAVININLEI